MKMIYLTTVIAQDPNKVKLIAKFKGKYPYSAFRPEIDTRLVVYMSEATVIGNVVSCYQQESINGKRKVNRVKVEVTHVI